MRAKLIIIVWVMATFSNAATPFHTPRLAKIAHSIHIHLTDIFSANTFIDSVAYVNGKDIHIHTNGLGDVDHIGYNLFSQELRNLQGNSPVFDFLERYLLELDLQLDERSSAVRMDADQVTFAKGDIQMLRQLTPKTDINLDIDVMPRKMYRVTCEFDKQEVRVIFPSTNELLIGANMIELEDIFKRDVQRMVSITADAVIYNWADANVSCSDDILIIDGGMYLSKMIRGDIYLKEQNGIRKLLCNRQNAARSISNIMLTGIFDRDILLKMEIDKYGSKKDSVEITLQQFISYCKAEGCKLYFGIKTISEDILTGTFFAYNERYSYDHMLTITFPFNILEGCDESVKGKVYTYIPLHTVADQYFNIYQEPITN